jgi:hypothetical protein
MNPCAIDARKVIETSNDSRYKQNERGKRVVDDKILHRSNCSRHWQTNRLGYFQADLMNESKRLKDTIDWSRSVLIILPVSPDKRPIHTITECNSM